MTGIETTAGGALLKVAIERGAPRGRRLITSWLKGKTIMVVGPPRSGKTTFTDYLQYGIFQHEQETLRTYDPISSPRFELKLGADQKLEVFVKTTIDVPGQYADALAKETFKHRPHGLVIMLDMSVPLMDDDEARSSAKWLSEFTKRLDAQWQNAKSSRNRLRSVIVALNKADLVEASVLEENKAALKAITDQHWHAARGPDQRDIVFRRCIAVENPDGTKWLDAILVDLARTLTEQ